MDKEIHPLGYLSEAYDKLSETARQPNESIKITDLEKYLDKTIIDITCGNDKAYYNFRLLIDIPHLLKTNIPKKQLEYQSRFNEAFGYYEIKKIKKWLPEIEDGDDLHIPDILCYAKEHPEYKDKVDEAVSKVEIPKLERLMEIVKEKGIDEFRVYSEYKTNRLRELSKKYPEYQDKVEETIKKGEIITLEDYIEQIAKVSLSRLDFAEKYLKPVNADVDSPFRTSLSKLINKTQELAEGNPGYKDKIDNAIAKHEVTEIIELIKRIYKGKTEWSELALELSKKHPEYEDEVRKAINQ